MGRRGPLKLVTEDTPDDQLTAGAVVATGAPPMPSGMSPAAEEVWDVLVPKLDELGLVAEVDGLTIDLYISHYLAAKQAADELAESAAVAIDDPAHKGRLQKHPADAVFRLHSELALKYANALGLSFAARARLSMRGDSDGDEGNPFEPPAAATGSG